MVTASRLFPARMRADLQLVIDNKLTEQHQNLKLVGIHSEYAYGGIKFPQLWKKDQHPISVGPLQYEDVDIGELESIRCLKTGCGCSSKRA